MSGGRGHRAGESLPASAGPRGLGGQTAHLLAAGLANGSSGPWVQGAGEGLPRRMGALLKGSPAQETPTVPKEGGEATGEGGVGWLHGEGGVERAPNPPPPGHTEPYGLLGLTAGWGRIVRSGSILGSGKCPRGFGAREGPRRLVSRKDPLTKPGSSLLPKLPRITGGKGNEAPRGPDRYPHHSNPEVLSVAHLFQPPVQFPAEPGAARGLGRGQGCIQAAAGWLRDSSRGNPD